MIILINTDININVFVVNLLNNCSNFEIIITNIAPVVYRLGCDPVKVAGRVRLPSGALLIYFVYNLVNTFKYLIYLNLYNVLKFCRGGGVVKRASLESLSLSTTRVRISSSALKNYFLKKKVIYTVFYYIIYDIFRK